MAAAHDRRGGAAVERAQGANPPPLPSRAAWDFGPKPRRAPAVKMGAAAMLAFTRLSLARQFLLASFAILFSGMLIIGSWLGRQIESGVVNRAAAVTALYVDSFVAPHLQHLALAGRVEAQHVAALGSLMHGTALGQSIVTLKVWDAEGRVLYSTNPAIIGARFPVTSELRQAFAGEVRAQISDLSKPENAYERMRWPRLMEVYAPVRAEGTGKVLAVSEFYKITDDLEREVRVAQRRSWVVVGVATIAMYLLLAGLVGRASNTIVGQQRELRDKVVQLSALLAQNEALHKRVRRAAARKTALHERFLGRIAADLHDGPAQDLALALLRIEALADACDRCLAAGSAGHTVGQDFRTVRNAIDSALAELRAIASGLRLPLLETLSLAEVAERAVVEYRRKTGRGVALQLGPLPRAAPLPVKITLYRLLQESLSNGLRHAAGIEQSVSIRAESGVLIIEVSDAGPGFDPEAAVSDGRLGLAGMRERVEILGGTFDLQSAPATGTTVRAHLPIALSEVAGD
jgi:signal transduction histidine kinase